MSPVGGNVIEWTGAWSSGISGLQTVDAYLSLMALIASNSKEGSFTCRMFLLSLI